jgi:hypothetical protein
VDTLASKEGVMVVRTPSILALAWMVTVTSLSLIQADTKAQPIDAIELSRRIDALIVQRWQKESVVPANNASDSEFLRRIYLDFTGKIPSTSEARKFLKSTDSDKRAKLIDELLSRAIYATHMANRWRDMLVPGIDNNNQARAALPPFEDWLRLKFADNVPYDTFVEELLTYRPQQANPQMPQPARSNTASPEAYWLFNENKPENLAASSSRAVLGVQVQCAQCHDHKFADWKREQFWEFAAFFRMDEKVDRPIKYADNGPELRAGYLDGSKPKASEERPGPVVVAEWMTSASNPYFASATVNRLWKHCFGRGIVEPVDDFDPANPPSHPELLELLATQWRLHDHDLKYLLKAIANTRAYQLSSRISHPTQTEPTTFARMPLRGMTPEQLFDSVAMATGYRAPRANTQNNPFLANDDVRTRFLNKFAQATDSPTDFESSILQALTLMNGNVVTDATSIENSETLRAVVDAPFFNKDERINTLMVATLSRLPTNEEKLAFDSHIESVGEKQALADIFWAMLNSPEFVVTP